MMHINVRILCLFCREKWLNAGQKLGDCVLFFGNRDKQHDYLFE